MIVRLEAQLRHLMITRFSASAFFWLSVLTLPRHVMTCDVCLMLAMLCACCLSERLCLGM